MVQFCSAAVVRNHSRLDSDECLAIAEPTESRQNVVKARRLRGQVFVAQGKLDAAEDEFSTALQVARETQNPPQLWKTHAAKGELLRAQGRADGAREAFREAVAVIDGVAAGLDEEALRDTFLSSEHVQIIRHWAEA